MYKCDYCNKELETKCGLANHMRCCNKNPDVKKCYCQYCKKECKNLNSLVNHERYCKLNPNRSLTTAERGIKSFNPKNYDINKSSGSKTKTDIQNIQCLNCGLYFSKRQLPGHMGWCYKDKSEKPVLIGPQKVNIGITKNELFKYQKDHQVCEICGRTIEEATTYKGKYAAKRLCIDHDHKTNQFRGLLCSSCNRQLG